MSYLEAIFLGILQGLTEFFPVSSSGHLVLAQAILGVKQPGVSFELLLHLGSLLAVLIYFRRSIFQLIKSIYNKKMVAERKMILFLIIGTIPAGLAGLSLREFFESTFSNPLMTAVMLIITGLILFATRFKPDREREMTLISALIMGLGQALAILPGISRSGSTIAAGMLMGIKPAKAAEFSFLMAVPVIGGALVLKADAILAVPEQLFGQYLAGMTASFIFSLAAVYILLAVIKRGRFEYFAYYCFAAGITGLYLFI
jgi:undecaprenyl-diphosphatase